MKKSLLDILFASDKRKNVLLLLKDGPQEMEFLLNNVNTLRQALLPQMKILKKYNLIYQINDTYGLTRIGKLIADEMYPFLNTIEMLDENSHYFVQHQVDIIPAPFLKRIHEIKGFTLVEPSHVNSHDLNMDHYVKALESKNVYFVFTFMHPTSPSILKHLVDNDIHVSLIFTKELVDKLLNEIYDTCKSHFAFKNASFYVYDKDITISSLTVIDSGFLLRLRGKDNEFSNKQITIYTPSGRKWGKDLFDYYLKDAKLITEL
nr:winged helix-turn-helix domain-containing protein [uncultured Methanolobus sp.]